MWNLEKISFSIAAFPPRNSGHFGHEANGISNRHDSGGNW